MNIIFVSNYINHHQIPVSKKLNQLCKEENNTYLFMQTEPMEAERIAMGWDNDLEDLDFVQNYYDNEIKNQALIDSADLVIFGGTDDERYIQGRMKQKKIVWRYSERLYKTGRYKWISPRGLVKKFKDHTRHLRNTYLLCSGAYVAGDFRMILSYLGRKYKFGYFPKHYEYDIQKLIALKEESRMDGRISFLWAGRMISWKHADYPIHLAKRLKDDGYRIHITMIGGGELEDAIKDKIAQLEVEDCVELVGFKSPEQTRKYMEKSDFFLVTSDRQEGWGAVLNEAMNSGCVVIANKAIGAAPFLIQSRKNGYLYHRFMEPKMMQQVKNLMENSNLRKQMSVAAYETILKEWNSEIAATRLYRMMKASMEHEKFPVYSSGPLAKHIF